MSQLENKKSPHQRYKMAVADLLGPVGSEGWKLGHDFHETAQGAWFTVSESARREILSRLLRLNHERWEAEQRMNDEEIQDEVKVKSKRVKKSKSNDGQMGLL